jgi:hypothetical protein
VRQLSTTLTEQNSIHIELKLLYEACRKDSRLLTVRDCELLLRRFLASYPATTIVLDALDECDESKCRELIHALEDLVVQSIRPLGVFISSRPGGEAKQRFENESKIHIQASSNESDIAKFINSEIRKHSSWASFSPQFQHEIVEKLDTGAHGM